VFIITMVLTAILFVCIAIAFARDRAVSFRGYRIIISILAVFGSCIATFPHNYFLVQHQVGAGFLVGSIWLHTVFFIVDASKVSSKGFALFLQIMVQSTVLTYAFTFFVQATNRDIVQKFAIVGLALAIELSLGALCREPTVATELVSGSEIDET